MKTTPHFGAPHLDAPDPGPPHFSAPHLGERLTDLLDGRLDPEAAADARQHLDTCDECSAEFDALRDVRALVRRVDAPPARAGFWTHVTVRLAEESARLTRRRWIFRLVIPATLAMAVAAAVALVPVGQVPVGIDGYLYEHARYRAGRSFSDEAVVTLVGTDASLRLDPEVYGR
jgi:anti-sigma factor RsiW